MSRNFLRSLSAALLLLVFMAIPALADDNRNFVAHLSGDQEVPARETRAQGQAIFRLSPDGNELYYMLIVANVENVHMAHIHLAPAGVNGSIVAWLYPSAPPAQLIDGRFDGVLAEGTITASSFGMTAEKFADLLAAMRVGNTYVNVHTSQYPGGEIRGQIR